MFFFRGQRKGALGTNGLKSYGVGGDLLSLLECCPGDRKQRVVLNGQNSEGIKINSGVSQRSVLDPLYKIIGLLRRLSVCLLKNTLHTIYKSFARLHLDYGDIFYDKSDNQNFESKIGKIQYKAFIAITGAIQEASRKILYDELRLMSLKESE